MPITLKFYLDRATESACAAKGAQTSDLRNQHLTSELAWRAMADKLIHLGPDRFPTGLISRGE